MKPAFTADQLAAVFLTRWKARETANDFLRYLRPNTVLHEICSRRGVVKVNVGAKVTICPR